MKRPGNSTFETEVNDSVQLQDNPWGPKYYGETFETSGDGQVRWTCVDQNGASNATTWQVNVTEETESSDNTTSEDTSNSTTETDSSSDSTTQDGSSTDSTESESTSSSGGEFVLSSYSAKTPTSNLTVEFIDVGQADGMVLHFPDATMVVDTGGKYASSHDALLNHVAADGISTIDTLVLTHPDADHVGGCDELLADVQVENVVRPGLPKDTDAWNECEAAINNGGAEVWTDSAIDPDDHLNVTRYANVEVLHLDDSASDANEGSVVLQVTYGSTDFLLAGDIGCSTENDIVASGLAEDVEILKVAHHGSKYSTCNDWLDATQPETGVISVGNNNYGHPATETLDRLSSHNVNVFRTDENGDVTVRTNGQGYDVVPETETTQDDSGTSDGTQDSTENLVVTASVSDPEPCQYSDVTVTIEVTDQDGNPVEGANTTSTWHYKTTTRTESGTTDGSGVDKHTRDIGRASAGYEVDVNVDVEIGDQTGMARTSFTPQDC